MKTMFTFFMVIIALIGRGETVSDSLSIKGAKKIKRVITPQYVPLQFAGNIGFLSTGVGFRNRNDKYQLSIVYGYAPRRFASADSHLLTAKNIFHIRQFHLDERSALIPYAAVGISWEVGGRSFLTLPENMPPGYYDFPKSLHAIPAIGLKYRDNGARLKPFRGIEFFAEVTSVDAYVWYKFLSDDVEMHQILSLAFGIHLLR